MPLRCKATHGDIVENAFFDFLQPIVITLENVMRLRHIDVFLGRLRPWQLREAVKISANDADLGARRRTGIQSVNLTLNRLAHVLWKFFFLQNAAIAFDIGGFIRVLA